MGTPYFIVRSNAMPMDGARRRYTLYRASFTLARWPPQPVCSRPPPALALTQLMIIVYVIMFTLQLYFNK